MGFFMYTCPYTEESCRKFAAEYLPGEAIPEGVSDGVPLQRHVNAVVFVLLNQGS